MLQRRKFLKFLAASPLITNYSAFAQEVEETLGERLTDPSEVINVWEMEAVARSKVPPAHMGFLSTGTDSDGTLRANREGYTRFQIRPKRLVDVSNIDLSVNVLGAEADSPIFLCPVGGQGAFHGDAELAVARAAKAKGQQMILSTMATTSIEAVAEARDNPLWFQLYAMDAIGTWENSEIMLRRAEAAGCTAVALTIDLPAIARNTETQTIMTREDERDCEVCHSVMPRKPALQGLNFSKMGTFNPAMTWDVIGKIKEVTNMKVLIKGLEVDSDATLAVQHGAVGIIVSNHGGRATDTGRGSIECLPEVIAAVNGQIPVIVDGGIRRGTDVFKALALGASAVGIGRPYVWGLGAFGQAGVERVLDMLNRELIITMTGSGTPAIADIGSSSVLDVGHRVPHGTLGREIL